MDKPKVTVLIPIFNSEKTIKRAIESVNNQTYGLRLQSTIKRTLIKYVLTLCRI